MQRKACRKVSMASRNPTEQQLISNLQNQIRQLSNEGLLLSCQVGATLNRMKAAEQLAAERAQLANRLRMAELQHREMVRPSSDLSYASWNPIQHTEARMCHQFSALHSTQRL
jgi:hypothetical protein